MHSGATHSAASSSANHLTVIHTQAAEVAAAAAAQHHLDATSSAGMAGTVWQLSIHPPTPPPLPCIHTHTCAAVLQVKLGEFNTVKSQISAALRKAGGSLAVRDISGLVKADQVVDSENLTTVFVVVGKYSVKEWDSCYEKLADFVVSCTKGWFVAEQRAAVDQQWVLLHATLQSTGHQHTSRSTRRLPFGGLA